MTHAVEPLRALVLGGGGFLGTNLVHALRDGGHHVSVTHRGRALPFHLRNRVDASTRCDLGNTDALRAAMRDCAVVFHAAGYYPRYSVDRDGAVETALRETRNVLAVAREVGVRRVVYTSSIAVLRGATEDDLPQDAPTDSVYRAVKWHLERAVDDARREGLDVVTLRPGGCLGPWDLRGGTGALLATVVRGELPWFVDGTIHMVDVRDIARAHVAAMGAYVRARYNLAGHTVTARELFRRVVARHGGRLPSCVAAPDEARARADDEERAALAGRRRAVLPREFVDIALAGAPASDALARAELGFDPRPLDDSLDDAVAWFRRTGLLPPLSPRP